MCVSTGLAHVMTLAATLGTRLPSSVAEWHSRGVRGRAGGNEGVLVPGWLQGACTRLIAVATPRCDDPTRAARSVRPLRQVPIYSWYGAKLKMSDPTAVGNTAYLSSDTPMSTYANIHQRLEARRADAAKAGSHGPRVRTLHTLTCHGQRRCWVCSPGVWLTQPLHTARSWLLAPLTPESRRCAASC